jgi:hypothetical protein
MASGGILSTAGGDPQLPRFGNRLPAYLAGFTPSAAAVSFAASMRLGMREGLTG